MSQSQITGSWYATSVFDSYGLYNWNKTGCVEWSFENPIEGIFDMSINLNGNSLGSWELIANPKNPTQFLGFFLTEFNSTTWG